MASAQRILVHQQPGVEALVDDVEERQPGQDRARVGHERPAVDCGPERRHDAHHLALPDDGTQRHPATERLAQRREVGRDAELALGTPGVGPEAGQDLVEDEHRPVLAGQPPGSLEIAGQRRDRARIDVDRLHDHARDLRPEAIEDTLQRRRVVPGQDEDARLVRRGVPALSGRTRGRPSSPGSVDAGQKL